MQIYYRISVVFLMIIQNLLISYGEDFSLQEVDAKRWGIDYRSFEYIQEFPENGVQAVSRTVLEVKGDFAYYALPRSDNQMEGTTDLLIQNPGYSFHIRRKDSADMWELVSLDFDEGSSGMTVPAIVHRELERIRVLPFSVFNGQSVNDFTKDYSSTR